MPTSIPCIVSRELFERDGQPEVADLRRAVGSEPDVARLEVAVDDVVGVRVRQAAADRLRDLQRPLDGQRQVEAIDGAAGHVLADDVGLARLLADVVDRDDVRVVAEAAHSLRLAPHREPVRHRPGPRS